MYLKLSIFRACHLLFYLCLSEPFHPLSFSLSLSLSLCVSYVGVFNIWVHLFITVFCFIFFARIFSSFHFGFFWNFFSNIYTFLQTITWIIYSSCLVYVTSSFFFLFFVVVFDTCLWIHICSNLHSLWDILLTFYEMTHFWIYLALSSSFCPVLSSYII